MCSPKVPKNQKKCKNHTHLLNFCEFYDNFILRNIRDTLSLLFCALPSCPTCLWGSWLRMMRARGSGGAGAVVCDSKLAMVLILRRKEGNTVSEFDIFGQMLFLLYNAAPALFFLS